MRRRDFITALLVWPLGVPAGHISGPEPRCRWLKTRLRHLDSRLRAGYRGAAGRRLRARRRQLAKDKFRACR